MEIERHPAGDPETWRRLRGRDVTASVAAALFGAHPFVTPFELYAVKARLIPRDTEETPAMRRGTLLEPVAVKLLAEERPRWRIWHNTGPEQAYFRDPAARIGATPDVIAKAGGRPGVVQIKSVEQSVFRQRWFSEEGELEAPLYVAIQAIVEGVLTGAEWAAAAALVVSRGIDLHVVEVPLNRSVYARLADLTAEFWRRVDERDPPPADYGRDGEVLARMFERDAGTEIDLSRDNRMVALLEEREAAKALVRDTLRTIDALDAEIIEKLGAHERAFVPGWSVARPLVERKGHFVEPTEYRSLRIRRQSQGSYA